MQELYALVIWFMADTTRQYNQLTFDGPGSTSVPSRRSFKSRAGQVALRHLSMVAAPRRRRW